MVMGCYDTITYQCPSCSHPISIQTKAGDCNLGEYTIYNAPPAVLASVHREASTCIKCGRLSSLYVTCAAMIQSWHDREEYEWNK